MSEQINNMVTLGHLLGSADGRAFVARELVVAFDGADEIVEGELPTDVIEGATLVIAIEKSRWTRRGRVAV